jgi:uncharacterized protein YndB with AHSA1/START domain
MPSTIALHRVFATTPEKLYRAFTEAEAMSKWIPPNGFTCSVERFEARVGGSYRMRFRNFTNGESHAFGGDFVEMIPGERLVYTDRFDDPNLPGEIRVTVTIRAVPVGAELRIEQANVPDIIPESGCYASWQQSLANLARLVEPDLEQH